ncbi:MAG: hypothetical protein ACYDBQ_10665 [Thermoplasmatota archaeon]
MRRLAVLLLLAGCAAPGPALQALDGHERVTDPRFPGVELSAALSVNGSVATVAVVAQNMGSSTYTTKSACVGIFEENLTGPPGNHLTMREPIDPFCGGGVASFGPSQARASTLRWDATLWEPAAPEPTPYSESCHAVAHARPAPAGLYRWALGFPLSGPPTAASPDGGGTLWVTLRLQLSYPAGTPAPATCSTPSNATS